MYLKCVLPGEIGMRFQTLSILLVAQALCLSVAANAQTSMDDRADKPLEEIIVTAQKREQSLKDVPMSVSVVDGERLAGHEADNYLDVFDLTVGLDFEQSADGDESRSTIITVRGVGSEQNTTGLQPSTTVMVDGEVLSRTAALNGDLVDIARIEVLRGPQSTLYGANASSGIIHTISRRPKLGKRNGEVGLLVAQDDEYRINGVLNVPMGERSALRLNGFYKDFGGYIENLYPGNPNGGEMSSYGGRAQLLFQPSDTLSILVRGDYSDRDNVAAGSVIVGMEDPTHPIISLTGGRYDADNDTTTLDPTQYANLNSWGVSTEIEKELGAYTLTYSGYYRNWELWENLDPDKSALRMSVLQFGGISESKTTQHELRLTSPANDRFDYIVGAYLYNTDDFRDAGNERCTRDPAGATLDPETLQVINCRRTDPPYNRIDNFTTSIGVTNYALFGNSNIRATDRVTFVLGGRFLWEKTEFEYEGGRNEIPYFEDSVTDSALIGRAGLQFDVNESAMVYATYSTGWKGRAYLNTGNLTTEEADLANSPFPLDPEEVDQIEVGLRSVLLDNRLQFNFTYYDADFENFQERVRFEDENGDIVSTLRSIPSVRSKGYELEAIWQATDGLRFTVAVADNETTYDVPAGLIYGRCPAAYSGTELCVTVDGNELIDLAGKTRPNAPELTYVLGVRYQFDVGSSGARGSVALNHKYTDMVLKGLDQDPLRAIEEEDVTNLNMVLNSPSERFRWNLYVKNLFDERLIRAKNYNPANNFGGKIVEALDRNYQRYWGASVTIKFGK